MLELTKLRGEIEKMKLETTQLATALTHSGEGSSGGAVPMFRCGWVSACACVCVCVHVCLRGGM